MGILYKKQPLKDFLSAIVEHPNDLNFLNSKMEKILTKEYQTSMNMDSLIEDILKREEIRKIIIGEYQRTKKNSWNYHHIPLKKYLEGLLENKEDLDFLYDKIKRILKKEYTPETNLDLLIDDILNRDEIQKIIMGTYEKRKTKSWYYQKISLKKNLYGLLENKEDVDYLYGIVSHMLLKEYTPLCNVDSLIEDILNRPKIQEIINGTYSKKEETEWIFQGMTLTSYVEMNIKSPYRSSAQIIKGIRTHISSIIKRNNLDVSKREELLDTYLSSEEFKQLLSTPITKKLSYFYQGMTLRKYVKEKIKNIDNLEYVYKFITLKIRCIYQEKNQDLAIVINSVMQSEETKKLLSLDTISKREREEWSYKEGLLIDYLKTIDLNGKKITSVYHAIKSAVKRRNKGDFTSLHEKEKAIEEFLNSEDFRNYLKYGYTSKGYFYSGMLLIDYLRLYYEDILKNTNKTIEDLYKKVLYMALKTKNPEDMKPEEIEREFDIVLRSNEISEYLLHQKPVFENWSYQGGSLKNALLKEYSAAIEEEQDVNRIYASIIGRAKKIKKGNPNIPNDTILSSFFEKEFIENYVKKYSKRKKIRKEVHQRTELYENRDDFQYINLYAAENKLDITEIVRITHLGFNYYSAITILEYANKFDEKVDEVIEFTLNMDKSEDISLLWLVKLGFKDYIWDVIENNKDLIHVILQENMTHLYKKYIYMDYEDLYLFLSEQLVQKFITMTGPIEYLFMSFKSFINSCIKKYVIEKSHNPFEYRCHSIDDENNSFAFMTLEDNIETSLIENETSNIIMDALDLLDNLEREFIDLRYGFRGDVNNLTQIRAIWSSKGILVSIEELEKMEKIVLEKLRKNPKILEIRQTA